jgi:hypothetical protein
MDILLPDPKILAQTDIVAGLEQLLSSDALIVTEREQRACETDALPLPVAENHSGAARHFTRICI